jgi:hypothetical protein
MRLSESSAVQPIKSGRGSAWLERLVRDQEVGGSNPLAPTIYPGSTPIAGGSTPIAGAGPIPNHYHLEPQTWFSAIFSDPARIAVDDFVNIIFPQDPLTKTTRRQSPALRAVVASSNLAAPTNGSIKRYGCPRPLAERSARLRLGQYWPELASELVVPAAGLPTAENLSFRVPPAGCTRPHLPLSLSGETGRVSRMASSISTGSSSDERSVPSAES